MTSLSQIQSTSSNTSSSAPYPRPRYTLAIALRQYQVVLRTLLADYRLELPHQIFFGIVTPIAFVFFTKAIGGPITPQRAIFLLGGNLTLSIALGPTGFLLFKLSWARYTQEFNYWMTLPVPKMVLVFALITLGLLPALPGLLATYFIGSIFLGVPFSGGWVLPLLVPLGVLPLTGFGAFLGSYAPSPQIGGMFYNVLFAFVGFLSPVMIPPEALPVPLRLLSWLIPTTYAADAFRAALGGQITTNIAFDVLILALFSFVFLVIVHRRLDWRTA